MSNTQVNTAIAGTPVRIPELDSMRAFAVFAVLSHHYLLGYALNAAAVVATFEFIVHGRELEHLWQRTEVTGVSSVSGGGVH